MREAYALNEADQVSHRPDGKVKDDIHTPRVNSIDKVDPLLQSAVMGIKDRKVESGVACVAVSGIDTWG